MDVPGVQPDATDSTIMPIVVSMSVRSLKIALGSLLYQRHTIKISFANEAAMVCGMDWAEYKWYAYKSSSGATSPLSLCFVLSHALMLLMLSRIVFAILLSCDLDSDRSGCRVCYRHVHPQEMVTGSGIYNILCVLYRVCP